MPAFVPAIVDWSALVLRILLTGIVLIVLVIICMFLIAYIQRTLAVTNKREHIIKLNNQGNFTSIFMLSVVSVEQMFHFKFLLNNIPLVEVSPTEEILESGPVDSVVSGPSSQIKTDKKATTTKSGVVKSGRAVAARAGTIAAFLSTLASLLPGSLGSGLRAQSESLREAQSRAQAAAQAPEDAQRKVDSLQQQSGKMAGVKPAATENKSPTTHQVAVGSGSQSADSESRLMKTAATKKVIPGVYKVQTGPLLPGAELSLVLHIEAAKRSRPAGTFAYTLSSQQLPMEEGLDGGLPAVTRQGILHFSHIDVWRYWLAPVSSVLAIAILLFTLILIFRSIWY